jgi:hypothetical protein
MSCGRQHSGMGNIVKGCSAKLRVGRLHNRRDSADKVADGCIMKKVILRLKRQNENLNNAQRCGKRRKSPNPFLSYILISHVWRHLYFLHPFLLYFLNKMFKLFSYSLNKKTPFEYTFLCTLVSSRYVSSGVSLTKTMLIYSRSKVRESGQGSGCILQQHNSTLSPKLTLVPYPYLKIFLSHS